MPTEQAENNLKVLDQRRQVVKNDAKLQRTCQAVFFHAKPL